MIANSDPAVRVVQLGGDPKASRVAAWTEDGGPLICGPHGLTAPTGEWVLVGGSEPVTLAEADAALHAELAARGKP